MNKKIVSEVVVYSFNGNIDEPKTVEVEGKKYLADDTDATKQKLVDGKPVEYVPKTAPVDGDKSLEELAKTNPALAELLKQKADADKKLSDAEAADSIKRQKDLEKNGEWEKLAKEKDLEIERLKGEDKKKFDLLGKYQGSIKTILAATIATIPKEKLGLIPENFSEREKLEYITKNAVALGATVLGKGKGDKIEGNDDVPNLTEEATLQKEFQALVDKGSKRTASEDQLMTEKSRKLKELRTARQTAKK